MSAQHWCDQFEDFDLGPFDACFKLFNEGFDGIWTCFKFHEHEGAKTDWFGGDSLCVAE